MVDGRITAASENSAESFEKGMILKGANHYEGKPD
jgi:hypothetical protein